MRKQLIFICTLLCFAFHAQNWNVFNKNYRYNYKFDHSDLVSNVLFADSVKQAGADTIYYLNRIGVECKGTCPTVTAALNPTVTYVVPNMPQFLQRRIKKYANGLVMLLDTSKQVIMPTCTVTQTWRFDSIYNFDATCVSASSLTVFGQSDSVKTIIVNGTDTILLSKNFGILQFPEPYTKNKYYRLAGIENKNSYDQTALYGEKVPNAWDFYNYDVGDVSCYSYIYFNTLNQPSGCFRSKSIVTSKSVSVNGYTFSYNTCYVNKNEGTWGFQGYCGAPPGVLPLTCTTTEVFTSNTALSSPTNSSNFLYPGQMLPSFSPPLISNIVRYGLDNGGRFYKYTGQPCFNSILPQLPNQNAIRILEKEFNSDLYYSLDDGWQEVAICFGVGFGEIKNAVTFFEGSNVGCTNSYTKNGVTYFGPTDPIGIQENSYSLSNQFFHPNPASTKVMLPEIEGAHVKVYNSLGQLVLSAENQSSIDVSSFQNGIYLLTLENSSFKISKKLVVEH